MSSCDEGSRTIGGGGDDDDDDDDFGIDTVAELGQPASGGQLNGPDIGQKYKESEDLLQVIKSIDFTKTVKRAEEEFR